MHGIYWQIHKYDVHGLKIVEIDNKNSFKSIDQENISKS